MPFWKEGQLPSGNNFTCWPSGGYASSFSESLSSNDLTAAMR